jgi:hypothetical protein
VVAHSRASLTLDVYSHALLDEPAEELAALRRSVVSLFDGEERAPHGYTGGYTEQVMGKEKPRFAGLF